MMQKQRTLRIARQTRGHDVHALLLSLLMAGSVLLSGCAASSNQDSNVLEVEAITTTKANSSGISKKESEDAASSQAVDSTDRLADAEPAEADDTVQRVEKMTSVVERPSATNMLTEEELRELWSQVSGAYEQLLEPFEDPENTHLYSGLEINPEGLLQIDPACESICGMKLQASEGTSAVQGEFLGVNLLEPGIYEGVLQLENGATGLMRLYLPEAARSFLARKYGGSVDDVKQDAYLFVDISDGRAWQLQ